MTPMHKTVKRRTVGQHYGRRIVVALHAGDVLGFRLERSRKEFLLSVASAYLHAVRLHVEHAKREKMLARGKPVRVKRGML